MKCWCMQIYEGGWYIWRKAGKALKSHGKAEKQRKSAGKSGNKQTFVTSMLEMQTLRKLEISTCFTT